MQPDTRRQKLAKALVIAVWMVFLGGPVVDLWSADQRPLATSGGALGLAAFIATYAALIFRHTRSPLPSGRVHALLAVMFALALTLSLTMGDPWLVLFVYFAVASGAVLPGPRAVASLGLTVVALAAIGTRFGTSSLWGHWTSLLVPVLLGGFALMSARKMVLTLRELREARATVARLAANEERLRLARDLHDLLGHSLSLITLKSELAGRMLPARAEQAAEQVADIERVSRQALVDVREAVSGYRRPTLAVELAGARTALVAAGIRADVPSTPPEEARTAPEQEAALAWALREAVTNVVRHSGADRCAVSLAAQADDTVCLTVTDNGAGPSGLADGSGLAGLRERLALADGHLDTAAGVRGGFTLRATVPAGSVT
ncbi:sensor histidine kinase [Streptomyces iconiensis]|uniref:Sensor histidine kinase n=1 Tax=Streptomyces iconiensis TaxID=1384038 RepID=A0ABT7A5U8_9ACTN|nr:sensor histidine kinase [Streptomyces iconiensis]MDJ1136705.1 sensor histidine kinase [Streptomyces iconiensis]